MGKQIKRIFICLVAAVSFWCFSVVRDRQQLNRELVRLHVVANSDGEEDQTVKLLVRDAILNSLKSDLKKLADAEKAKQYLRENLPKIEAIANKTLELAGFEHRAAATLCRESFDTRYYDTFTLPAGVYDALRVTIGDGAGKNWWCVAFPSLCLPATTDAFGEAAVEAGLSQPLTGALSGEKPYQVRFFLLDALGKVENIFFSG